VNFHAPAIARTVTGAANRRSALFEVHYMLKLKTTIGKPQFRNL
jgi:hypothetical protein